MHSLAWLKRQLPVIFRGVGAFLLMASGGNGEGSAGEGSLCRAGAGSCGSKLYFCCQPGHDGLHVAVMLWRWGSGVSLPPTPHPSEILLASRPEHHDQLSLGTGEG